MLEFGWIIGWVEVLCVVSFLEFLRWCLIRSLLSKSVVSWADKMSWGVVFRGVLC